MIKKYFLRRQIQTNILQKYIKVLIQFNFFSKKFLLLKKNFLNAQQILTALLTNNNSWWKT